MDDIQVATNPKEVAALIDPTLKPADDFEKTLAEIDADKKKKEADRQKLAELQVVKQPKPKEIKPITLHYKYTGNCICETEVTTLMVEVKGSLFAIAYCPNCQKQILSVEVQPIINITKLDSVPSKPVEPPKTAEIIKGGIIHKEEGKK